MNRTQAGWRARSRAALYVLQGMRRDSGPITDVFSGVMPFMLV
jgi:hypothetical protein